MKKVFEKRRYQERCVEAFKDWSKDPNDKLATVLLPTGTGKTLVISQCYEWMYNQEGSANLKLLWGAHRKELVEQAFETLKNLIPNKIIEIEMGDNRASSNADIIVGSVQSFARNRKNMIGFKPNHIVVDEWHHFHENNTQYNGLLEKYPDAKVIGATATAYRFTGGKLPLGRKLIEMDIGTAIRHNYLVPIKPEILKTDISLANVHKQNGDFNITELSKTINVDKRNQLIVDRIIKAVKEEGRKGIVFAADVHHSHTLYELLKDHVRAAEVYGTTDDDERSSIIEKVRAGEIDIVLNYGLFLEGFDAPILDMVCIARPTMSLGLYLQMVGRVLRLFTGKTNALLIDVFDKVKITQGRITYPDMVAAGDIDGSEKRTDAILKEPIADMLKNFPVMMRVGEEHRLTIDNETWFAPAWILAENQWVISWTKSEERIIIENEYELSILKYPPNMWNLRKNHMQVHHRLFGAGVAFDIDTFGKMMINFEDGIGLKSIEFGEISKREIKYEKKKLDKPIRRVFFICMKNNGGRLISLLQQDKNSYKVVEDIRGDKTTIDEFMIATANDDDMIQIVKVDAKWREKQASDKQKDWVKKLIVQKKTADDIDFSSFSAGDASSIIDQVSWHGAINNLFGTIDQKELIGYSTLSDDV